jgi:adenylate cyclase
MVGVYPPRRYPGAWWIVTAASMLGVAVACSNTVRRLDWLVHDSIVTVATYEPSPPADIVVVAIDEASVEQLRMPWPWPRRVHAALVGALTRSGARAIVFDLPFDEPSSVAEDDGILREAIDRAGNVVLAIDRRPPRNQSDGSPQWARPIPSLASAASALGAATLIVDPDGVVRRYSVKVDNQLSLAAAVEPPEQSAVPAGGVIPFNGRPGAGIRTVSYYRALQTGQLPQGYFREKTVLVGRLLPAVTPVGHPIDFFRTPVGPMAGVEIHASALDALSRRRFVRDPFSGTLAMAILLTPIGVFSGWLVFRAGSRLSLVVVMLAATAWSVASYLLRAQDLIRLPVVAPLATAATVVAVSSAFRLAASARERRLRKSEGGFSSSVD